MIKKHFSDDVFLIAPFVDMADLYWTDSKFSWNDSLKARL